MNRAQVAEMIRNSHDSDEQLAQVARLDLQQLILDPEKRELWLAAAAELLAELNEAEFLAGIAGQLSLPWLRQWLAALAPAAAEIQFALLNFLRRPPVATMISRAGGEDEIFAIISERLRRHKFNFWQLLVQRRREYDEKAIFLYGDAGHYNSVSYREVCQQVSAVGAALMATLAADKERRVGIIAFNSVAMAIADWACLASGIEVAMLPPNASPGQLEYMLGHANCQLLFIGGESIYHQIKPHLNQLPEEVKLVSLDSFCTSEVESFAAFRDAHQGANPAWEEQAAAVDPQQYISIMYTSGTTGYPKGIRFTTQNMLSKRFARGLALPEIGDTDVLLCYLPLFHTFGRYLELQGALFWGAIYCFAASPALASLLQHFQALQPSVFISIPRKWQQLYAQIASAADPETAASELLRQQVEQVTGGKLRWGLSAAGYLEAGIFRFFQQYGVQLLSGFGMTEASGGILMTPPGRYKDDSLGIALPGIEARLADDGELQIRGDYVFPAYFRPPDEAGSERVDAWFATGDIMRRDHEGYYTIVDRKKEIYKNSKGQTIAPQKIENLFRDFPAVAHVFLVGDHREYNTILIWLQESFEGTDLKAMPDDEKRAFVASLVSSVNRFLSPFERIINFAILAMPLDQEKYLTAKKTFKRRLIEEDFARVIDDLYHLPWFESRAGAIKIRIPAWFFREKGITVNDMRWQGDQLLMPEQQAELRLQLAADGRVIIGDFCYHLSAPVLEFEELFSLPVLWLGNAPLVDFFSLPIFLRDRPFALEKRSLDLQKIGMAAADPAFSGAQPAVGINGLGDIHRCLIALRGSGFAGALELLTTVLENEQHHFHALLRKVIRFYPVILGDDEGRKLFSLFIRSEKATRLLSTAGAIWQARPELFNRDVMTWLAETGLSAARLMALLEFTKAHYLSRLTAMPAEQQLQLQKFLEFFSIFGAARPASIHRIRPVLARFIVQQESEAIKMRARDAYYAMLSGVRKWLGPVQHIAIDPENGNEYRWPEVVVFNDDVDAGLRQRVLALLREEGILKESIFMLTARQAVQLRDIPVGGIWVSALPGSTPVRRLRLTVQTRAGDTFDIKLNIQPADALNADWQQQFWQIIAAEDTPGPPLTNAFLSAWEKAGIWTEAFAVQENLQHYLERHWRSQKAGARDKVVLQWPHFVWSAAKVLVTFWQRSQQQLSIADLRRSNFIIPPADYQIGATLIRLEIAAGQADLATLLSTFWQQFVQAGESGEALSAGAEEAEVLLAVLHECLVAEDFARQLTQLDGDRLPEAVAAAVAKARQGKIAFYPEKLFFAIRRYRRWTRATDSSDPEVHAATINELVTTYQLDQPAHLAQAYRVRFFLATVLQNSSAGLRQRLEDYLRRLPDVADESAAPVFLSEEVGLTRELNAWEQFFLARLSHRHLQPETQTSFIELEQDGRQKTEIVVSCEDREGETFVIRGPLSPREAGRLYHLFLQVRLPVRFRPEHRFLLAISPRGAVIGGLFYFFATRKYVRMEKIVVRHEFRRRGISELLLRELFARLQNAGVERLSTGFYRPEYFYKFGFRLLSEAEGLVRDLRAPEEVGGELGGEGRA
jgi:long-chain acyl-CoA synthetase